MPLFPPLPPLSQQRPSAESMARGAVSFPSSRHGSSLFLNVLEASLFSQPNPDFSWVAGVGSAHSEEGAPWHSDASGSDFGKTVMA